MSRLSGEALPAAHPHGSFSHGILAALLGSAPPPPTSLLTGLLHPRGAISPSREGEALRTGLAGAGPPGAPFLSRDRWEEPVHGETTRCTGTTQQLHAGRGPQPRPALSGHVCPADGLLGWNIPKHERHCRRVPAVFAGNTEQLGLGVSAQDRQGTRTGSSGLPNAGALGLRAVSLKATRVSFCQWNDDG